MGKIKKARTSNGHLLLRTVCTRTWLSSSLCRLTIKWLSFVRASRARPRPCRAYLAQRLFPRRPLNVTPDPFTNAFPLCEPANCLQAATSASRSFPPLPYQPDDCLLATLLTFVTSPLISCPARRLSPRRPISALSAFALSLILPPPRELHGVVIDAAPVHLA